MKYKPESDLPQLLRTWRASRGFTQRTAATFLDISHATYLKWEYGLRLPSRLALASLLQLIGVK